jgi:hypothetical protein
LGVQRWQGEISLQGAVLPHMTDQRDCSCQDRQRSRNVRKHMRTVRFWMAAFATGAVAPKTRPGATAEDDRVVLTPAGACYLAEQEQPTDAVAPSAYARLYPTCRAQSCQDDPEPGSLDCYRHQLVDAF